MKNPRLIIPGIGLGLFALALISWFLILPQIRAHAQTSQANKSLDLALISEATGMEASEIARSAACTFDKEYEVYLCPPPHPATLPLPKPEAKNQALQVLGTSGLLLIPDSTNKRVMAFDPISGDLIDADFVPADPTHLSTPVQAILSTSGTLLVSDQINDVVQEYALDGNYLGIFAPAGGVNNAILDNIRGIQLR
ncbi:MAG: hypothetical protein HUU38_32435, partial [Anaerolineales bacterium]|nr:hypothetical protein [Anaerolineales bacterium]